MAKISFPTGSRATRFRLKSVPAGTTVTQWHLKTSGIDPFILTTEKNGVTGSSANVLIGRLSYIDVWLPPFHDFQLKTRHLVNGKLKPWSSVQTFTSRGPLNSYENFLALSNNNGLDNVIR